MSNLRDLEKLIYQKEMDIKNLEKSMQNFDKLSYLCQDDFDSILDDIYEQVEICGYIYSASHALKLVDQCAYNQEFINYVDSLDFESFESYRELSESLEELENELIDLQGKYDDQLLEELSDNDITGGC